MASTNSAGQAGRWYWTGLAAVIVLGIFLRCQHMTDMNSRSPDERTYTNYAAALADGGIKEYRELFTAYNAEPGQWVNPAPSRFGFVLLSAGVMDATGVRNPRAGAAISWLFGILSLVLLAWLGIRFFGYWPALLAVGFLVGHFGELSMGRRSWQDSIFGFLGLLLVYVTCEITRATHKKSLYVALFAVGTYSLLIKETAYATYGICGLWLAVLLVRERQWKLVGVLAATGLASVAMTLAVWAAIAGSPATAIEAIGHLLHAASESTYAAQAYSGPWYQFFYLLWIAGPLTAAMALLGAGLVLFSPTRLGIPDVRAARVAALMTAAFVGLSAFGPNLQNLRIISPSDATYCLLAGIGFWYLLSRARTLLRQDLLVALLALICLTAETVRNYNAFTQVVVGSGMEDLAVSGIRTVMGR